MDLPTCILKFCRERGDLIEIDLQIYAWPVQCQQQSVGNVCWDNNKRTQKLYKLKKLRCCQNFFSLRIVVGSWNSLPPDVANAPSLQAFKGRLDSIWQDRKFLHQVLPTKVTNSVTSVLLLLSSKARIAQDGKDQIKDLVWLGQPKEIRLAFRLHVHSSFSTQVS